MGIRLGASETELEDIVGICDGACEGGKVEMSLGTVLGGLVLGRSEGLVLGRSEGLGVGSPVEGASEGSIVGD